MIATLKISTGQYSDKGRKSSNQDFHGIRVPKDSLLEIKGIAVAMADGISSSYVSQIASETAVKTFLEDYYCTSEAWSVKGSVDRVLNSINSWLHSQTMRGPHRYDKNKGYVCTFSTLVIKNHSAHIFHLGDTRVYRLNDNGLEQLTNDHRLWESEEHSYLSRALGIDPTCNYDHQSMRVKVGDIFILSTDGVYEFVNTKKIIKTIADNNQDLDAAAKIIVSLAYEAGSDDNLSIQIVRIDELPEQTSNKVKQQAEQLPLPPLLEARQEFDGYIILRKIHGSSRSHVYLAQDIETKKNVVLKAPSVDLGNDAEHLERLLMEEWIARRINSAHVLKADLPNRQRTFLYTVFEYIEGQTLAQWATDNPKPKLESVRVIVEQIAKGLHAFHRMEMLHQDIRPENILIDIEGTVKIIDFGSVSVAGIQESATKDPLTYLLGTALYSAPEYFLGEQGTIRSELFSLGVITYFLLSGKYPYGTKVAKTKTRSAQRKLWYDSVLDDDSEIPAWVDDAIHRAVSPLPERRYEELFEFIHDIRQPNKVFLNKTRPPLLERNPVAVWQGLSFILAVIIVYLLNIG
ncbi:MAG: serine/threonine protein phosphatase PrpC [Flavobacteriales bacterium]|jgi:serine/threonine protein phosphatase PrpC